MPRKSKVEDYTGTLKPDNWIFIDEEPQWWPGIHEGLSKAQAESQVGTCPQEHAKGYHYVGPELE